MSNQLISAGTSNQNMKLQLLALTWIFLLVVWLLRLTFHNPKVIFRLLFSFLYIWLSFFDFWLSTFNFFFLITGKLAMRGRKFSSLWTDITIHKSCALQLEFLAILIFYVLDFVYDGGHAAINFFAKKKVICEVEYRRSPMKIR